MTDIWEELGQRVKTTRTLEENEALVEWVIEQGFSELDARQMVQFALRRNRGQQMPA